MILVSKADIFLSESLRILAERLSQSEIGLPLRQICYYSPPEVGVFSTEINIRMCKQDFGVFLPESQYSMIEKVVDRSIDEWSATFLHLTENYIDFPIR